ncbi:MAG TPA: ferredoxin:glutaredoxin reductase [Clostridiales bacterium]|nr:ferredoxin:glutaredoxin reductase [Clostridiales bacterium]
MEKNTAEKLYLQMLANADEHGYKLNPDKEFCERLVAGIIKNNERYGIEACPCRLVTGAKEENLDIVCPCDYRDDDLAEYGACFCGLYVTDQYNAKKQVPDRRPPSAAGRKHKAVAGTGAISGLSYPVWRCNVCGYLSAMKNPPGMCPICKAGKERFARFL